MVPPRVAVSSTCRDRIDHFEMFLKLVVLHNFSMKCAHDLRAELPRQSGRTGHQVPAQTDILCILCIFCTYFVHILFTIQKKYNVLYVFCIQSTYNICTLLYKIGTNMYIVIQNMYNKISVVDTIGLLYNIKNVYNIDTR